MHKVYMHFTMIVLRSHRPLPLEVGPLKSSWVVWWNAEIDFGAF